MKIFEHISLKGYNTFGIDVKARRMVEVEQEGDLQQLPEVLGEQWMVLGAGSDVVFTHDYDGTIVRLADRVEVVPHEGGSVAVWAGAQLDAVVEHTLGMGLYGLENLTAIPGTVGAAVVQNVGAYGVEAKDVVEWVETYSVATGEKRLYAAIECAFGYRTSVFKQRATGEVIVRVGFRLCRDFVPNLKYKALESMPHGSAQEVRRSLTEVRWGKLPRPEEYGSAGSFFKNPVVSEADWLRLKGEYPDVPDAHVVEGGHEGERYYKVSAGWLIDKAGWKGRVVGRVGVWPRQALVLYNAGGCEGSEVVALATAIQQDVNARFGIVLEPEAIII